MLREATDVLVVGGGPAGMAAAKAAAASGRSVRLLDDNPALGGQIWRRDATSPGSEHNRRVHDKYQALVDAGVQVRLGAAVVDATSPTQLWTYDDGELVLVDATHVVLATGARELLLPFPGWTMPGVFGVGGLQALAKSGLAIEGKRIVIAGTGPLLLAVAANLRARGAQVVAIIEQAPRSHAVRFGLGLWAMPSKAAQGLALAHKAGLSALRWDSWVTHAEGTDSVERVHVRSGSGTTTTIECDLLACGYGLVPQTRLARLLGCAVDTAIEVDRLQRTSIPSVLAAGEPCGIGGQDKAEVEGTIAGLVAGGDEAAAEKLLRSRNRWRGFADRLARDFALRDELRALPHADTIVCRCEDVPLSAVTACADGRQAKLSTRCGMGPCQGRVCQPSLRFLLGHGHDRPRPPLIPLPLGVLAQLQSPPSGVSS